MFPTQSRAMHLALGLLHVKDNMRALLYIVHVLCGALVPLHCNGMRCIVNNVIMIATMSAIYS
eukprot:2011929-Amphidinium_carterae.1